MSIGRFPESLSRAMLVGIMLVGRLGVRSVLATSILRGGEGTVDWDAVASNRSMGNRLSNFDKRISSKNSNWDIWVRKAWIEQFELDEGVQPYHPPSENHKFKIEDLESQTKSRIINSTLKQETKESSQNVADCYFNAEIQILTTSTSQNFNSRVSNPKRACKTLLSVVFQCWIITSVFISSLK